MIALAQVTSNIKGLQIKPICECLLNHRYFDNKLTLSIKLELINGNHTSALIELGNCTCTILIIESQGKVWFQQGQGSGSFHNRKGNISPCTLLGKLS